VSVRMDQDDAEVEISQLGKGQYFGELALVTHRPRAASVYATGGVVKLACECPAWRNGYTESVSVDPPLDLIPNAFVYLFFVPSRTPTSIHPPRPNPIPPYFLCAVCM